MDIFFYLSIMLVVVAGLPGKRRVATLRRLNSRTRKSQDKINKKSKILLVNRKMIQCTKPINSTHY